MTAWSGFTGATGLAQPDTLFLSLAHARIEIAVWVKDYNRERPHSSLRRAIPAAFAAVLDKQWPASTALLNV